MQIAFSDQKEPERVSYINSFYDSLYPSPAPFSLLTYSALSSSASASFCSKLKVELLNPSSTPSCFLLEFTNISLVLSFAYKSPAVFHRISSIALYGYLYRFTLINTSVISVVEPIYLYFPQHQFRAITILCCPHTC